MKSLIASALCAVTLASVFVSTADAQISADRAYRGAWDSGRYGCGGPMDPRGWGAHCRGGVRPMMGIRAPVGYPSLRTGVVQHQVIGSAQPVLVRRFVFRQYFQRSQQQAATVVQQPAPVIVQQQVTRQQAAVVRAPVVHAAPAVVRAPVHAHRRVAKAAKPCDVCQKKQSVTVNTKAIASGPNSTATNIVSVSAVTLTGGPGSTTSATKVSMTGWQDHGKNDMCVGKPKLVKFRCTPPGASSERDCVCN